MRPAAAAISFCLAVTVAGTGCGPDRPKTVSVTGTVTYQGGPVDGAEVTFVPAEGRPANGTTDAEGRFELMTFAPGDGAVVGEHKVGISKREEMPDPRNPSSPYKMTRDLLPPRYANPAQSGLTATVEAGGENDFPFKLTD